MSSSMDFAGVRAMKQKLSSYQIVSALDGNIGPFQDEVARHMENGWVPVGSPTFNAGKVYQAMMLPINPVWNGGPK